MLRISLVFTLALLAWPLAALAQNNGAEALQIFEFDYDQKTAPVVNLPPRSEAPAQTAAPALAPIPAAVPTPAPAPAPAKAAAPTLAPIPAAVPAPAPAPAPAKAAAPAPVPAKAPVKAAAPAPAPAKAPVKAAAPAPAPAKAPVKAAAPAPAKAAASAGTGKDRVITIIGEPDPPGTRHDDYLPDYRAEEITLSPAGLPPTTKIPAKPGEARVEKSPKTAAQPTAVPTARRIAEDAAATDSEPGSIHRFWQFAHSNWARYGGTIHSRPPSASPMRTAAYGGPGGMLGYTASGVPLQDLTKFSGFYK